MYTMRAALPGELAAMQAIEEASGEIFREVGMPEIAEDRTLSIDALASFQKDGRAWVTADDAGRPVAFAVVEVIDGAAHVEQISVHPGHARRGIGARLLDHVAGWARARGLTALTLTTFRSVPWNGPYYERLGFTEVPPAERSPGLAALVAEEEEQGLDASARISMRRPL